MSKTISIRISDDRWDKLEGVCGDMSVHTFVKGKVEDYADKVTPPIYDPSKHKAGDKVTYKGKVVVVPEVDAEGNIIP